ncbi:MAG: RidA family protein [Sphingobacteriales bacterium]|nr:RidA family protein [Sphingobacteriales bacterium]
MKTFTLTLICILFIGLKTGYSQGNPEILKKEKFNINKSSEDEIGYTQAVKVGNTIYVSGAVGWGTTQEAFKLVYDELDKSLKAYGANFTNVVKENLYSTLLDSVIKYKEIRRKYYNNDFPAATWVEVKRLYDPSLILEVEIIAVLPEIKTVNKIRNRKIGSVNQK